MRLTMTFNMPYAKISANPSKFASDLQTELVMLTQLPTTHVTMVSVVGDGSSVTAVFDAFYDVSFLRTYAEATTFAMNAQVSPSLLGRSAFNAQYAPVAMCFAEIRLRMAGEYCLWHIQFSSERGTATSALQHWSCSLDE